MTTQSTIEKNQKLLLEKKASMRELVDAYLKTIQKYDGVLNSFITVNNEISLKKADLVDKLLSKNDKVSILSKLPLLGTVVSYKDLFLTKGIRTTAASKVLESFVPQYSATVVDKLEIAGCINIGKTNCDAWAHGSSGENSDYGVTKNPWGVEYVPGGSSSGSAVSVSANMCTVSLGTDTCGSIRLPANYTYTYGLKPTYGAVSRYGVIAMASSLDCIGHFSKTAADIKKVFEITKGRDLKDATLDEKSYNKKLTNMVIGVPDEFFQNGLSDEVSLNIKKAISLFEKNGVKFNKINLPHTKYGISVYYIIQPAEVSSNLSRYDGIRYGKGRDAFSEEAKRRIMLGTYVLSSGYYDAYYLKAMKVRSVIIREIDQAFKSCDAIIAPVSTTPPFKLGEKISDPLKMYLTDIYAATANLAGIPSLAIPFGFTNDGMPLGFQIMGPRYSENLLFHLAENFEAYSNYTIKNPDIYNL